MEVFFRFANIKNCFGTQAALSSPQSSGTRLDRHHTHNGRIGRRPSRAKQTRQERRSLTPLLSYVRGKWQADQREAGFSEKV